MKELFRQAGGVPRKIRIDNMSTAVTQTKSRTESAILTDGFLRFATHYGLLRFDSYQLISTVGEIISEGLRPYMMKKRAIDWQAIFLDWRRKPRAMHYSRYWKYLPERIKLFLSHPDWREQDQRLNRLLSLLVTHDMSGIDAHFYDLLAASSEKDAYDIDWYQYDAFLSLQEEVVH